jgi:hypothetical protein
VNDVRKLRTEYDDVYTKRRRLEDEKTQLDNELDAKLLRRRETLQGVLLIFIFKLFYYFCVL